MSLVIPNPYTWPITLRNATPTADGVMSAADKLKLDGLSSGIAYIVTPVKTSLYTAVASNLVRTNSTGGNFNVNMPSAAANPGAVILFYNNNQGLGGTHVAVTAAPGDTVRGIASFNLGEGYYSAVWISNGISDWILFQSA